MPYKDKEKQNNWQKLYQRRNRKKQHNYRRRLRIRAMEKLGNKCVNCGCNNPDALEFNHINGGGAKEKTGLENQMYLNIIAGRRTI